jgi:hypothetical protein
MKFLKLTFQIIMFMGICVCANAQIHTTGLSSKQMKSKLENSFLFKNTDIFFPNGVISNLDTLQVMSEDNLKEINKELNIYAKTLYKIATKEQPALEQLFGRKLNDPQKIRPQVWNERIPLARSEQNGLFRFDVQVAQAIFRATVLEGLKARQESIMNPEGFDSNTKQDTSEKGLLTTFIKEKNEIHNAKARGRLGDMIQGIKSMNDDDFFDHKHTSLDDPSTWFGMTQLAMSSMTTQMRYGTTMLFLFAHEMGHFALGHFREDTNHDCPKYRQQELDADRYAAYLMLKLFERKQTDQEAAINDFMGEIGKNWLGFDSRTLVGDEVFLRDAYVIAKFKNNGVECIYPSPGERLKQIDQIFVTITHTN